MKKFLSIFFCILVCFAFLTITVCAEADGTSVPPQLPDFSETSVTPMVIVAFFTFAVAEILKKFHVDTSNIPIINIGVGVVAGLVCYFCGFLPAGTPDLFVCAIIQCVIAACGAGGAYDLLRDKPVK